MAATWTSPRSWVVGEVVTAAQLNTHLRDNTEYLKDKPTFDGSQITIGTVVLADASGLLTIGGDAAAVRVSGSYTGDGTTTQTVSLPFTPTYVVVSVADSSAIASGFAVMAWLVAAASNENHTFGKDGAHRGTNSGTVSGGFEAWGQINQNTVTYNYEAFG